MVLSPAFTPQAATLGAVGGALIGALAVARIAGRRGMLPSATPVPLVTPSVMLGGFVIKTCLDGPAVSLFDAATATAMPADAASLLALVGAAACVGAGAKLGQGCTSGNGINGLAALSKASLVFVLTFMGAGATAASLLGSGAAHADAAAAAVAPDFPWLVLALGAAGIAAQLLLPASPAYKPDTLSVASIASPADALADLGAGLAFAAALAVSGMVKPSKVLGFLDLGSAAGWDPTLACVMGAALCVAAAPPSKASVNSTGPAVPGVTTIVMSTASGLWYGFATSTPDGTTYARHGNGGAPGAGMSCSSTLRISPP